MSNSDEVASEMDVQRAIFHTKAEECRAAAARARSEGNLLFAAHLEVLAKTFDDT